MVTMETVIFEQNSYYYSISCAIFNFKFLNIFVIKDIDDNWRYNVIYYVIYNRYIICWVPLNPFSPFRIYHDLGHMPSFSWWLFSHIHLQYQRITKRVFYDSCNNTPTCRSTMTTVIVGRA